MQNTLKPVILDTFLICYQKTSSVLNEGKKALTSIIFLENLQEKENYKMSKLGLTMDFLSLHYSDGHNFPALSLGRRHCGLVEIGLHWK